MILRFIHDENLLTVGGVEYKATCPVRNALNGERNPDQVVKTFPLNPLEDREAYDPRKFPTGVWAVKRPTWTEDPDYAPVKIPTDAHRRVLTTSGKVQEDAFYHLHYAGNSRTTLGCIRFDNPFDAKAIAMAVERELKTGRDVWLEVIASRACDRG